MALYTEPVVSIPVYRDVQYEREQAARFGLLTMQDIRRCLKAEYCHRTPEERQELLELDLRCAVGLARIAWRYALRAQETR